MGRIKERAKKFAQDSVVRWIQKNIGEGLTWLFKNIVVFLLWLIGSLGSNYIVGAISEFSLRPTDVFDWLLANPGTAYSVALATAGLFYLFRLARLKWANRVKEHRARVAIGLHTYFDPETDGVEALWKHCVDTLGKLSPTELNILGVTGWNTFASKSSPLHEFIDSFTGDLKILLLLPESPGFKSRVEDLAAMDAGTVSEEKVADLTKTLKREYDDTIEYCENLARKPKSRLRSITVKAYVDKPIWKLLFANTHVWVQQYDPHYHVADTPSFEFINNPSQRTSFQRAFQSVWHLRWGHKNTRTVVPRKVHK